MVFAGHKEQRTILVPEPYGELDNDLCVHPARKKTKLRTC